MCTIKTDLHMSVDTTASMHCDIGRIMDIMTVNIQVCYTHSDNIQCDFDFEHWNHLSSQTLDFHNGTPQYLSHMNFCISCTKSYSMDPYSELVSENVYDFE